MSLAAPNTQQRPCPIAPAGRGPGGSGWDAVPLPATQPVLKQYAAEATEQYAAEATERLAPH
jgi:hypothetical protein